MGQDYLWGWDRELISVPGFGFFPSKVDNELEALTEVNQILN